MELRAETIEGKMAGRKICYDKEFRVLVGKDVFSWRTFF